jgi:anti-sigma factor RsiW
MRCPDRELLSALADDELETAERAAIEPHVRGCPVCTEFVADMRRLNTLGETTLRTIPVPSRLNFVALPSLASAPPEPRLLPLAAAFAVLSVAAWLVAPPSRELSERVASTAAPWKSALSSGDEFSVRILAERSDAAGWQYRSFAEWLAQNSERRIPLIPLEEVPRLSTSILRPQIPPVVHPNW